jgi:replicative DNA helicase
MEAEQGVIGAMLLEADAANRALEVLTPEDWYREAHRTFFVAANALHAKREPVDLLTVVQYLRDAGELDNVGGQVYLQQCMYAVPTAARIGHYCNIVLAKAAQRRLIKAGAAVQAIGYALTDHATIEEMFSAAEEAVCDVTAPRREKTRTGPSTLADAMTSVWDGFKAAHDHGTPTGLAAPWPTVARTCGLFAPGSLNLIAARTGVGKTAFLLNLAMGFAEQGVAGLYASLEVTKREIAKRAMLTEMCPGRHGKLDEWGSLPPEERNDLLREMGEAVERLWNFGVHILDRDARTTAQIEGHLRRLHRGKRLGWLMVDYLQLMGPTKDQRNPSRAIELGRISGDLKAMAVEYGIPIFAAVQVNRDAEGERPARPALRNLKDSGSLEQDADLVLMGYRPSDYLRQNPRECLQAGFPEPGAYRDEFDHSKGREHDGLTEWRVLKNRHGACGSTVLDFRGEQYLFASLSPQQWDAMGAARARKENR